MRFTYLIMRCHLCVMNWICFTPLWSCPSELHFLLASEYVCPCWVPCRLVHVLSIIVLFCLFKYKYVFWGWGAGPDLKDKVEIHTEGRLLPPSSRSRPPAKRGQHTTPPPATRPRRRAAARGRRPADVTTDGLVIELPVQIEGYWYVCDSPFQEGPPFRPSRPRVNCFDKSPVKHWPQTGTPAGRVEGGFRLSPFGTESQNVGRGCEATQSKEAPPPPPFPTHLLTPRGGCHVYQLVEKNTSLPCGSSSSTVRYNRNTVSVN